MPRLHSRAIVAAVLVLASGCASGEMGTMLSSDAPPAPVLWKFETVSWYNRYSMNSTVGPLVVGKTVLYGGTYAYGNTKASKLALVDPATGTARWRTEYGGAFGPLALTPGMIAVAAGVLRTVGKGTFTFVHELCRRALLDGFDEVLFCTAYRRGRETYDHVPAGTTAP